MATESGGLTTAYARSLRDLAEADGVAERVADELFQLARVLEGSDDLRERLSDGRTDPETRAGIAVDVLEQRAHPHTVAAVTHVIRAGHARSLGEVCDAVAREQAAADARELAEVRSAVPLEATQRDRLARALAKMIGGEVELKTVVDPSLIGGVVARVGDRVIDGSVTRQLTDMRARMVGSE